MPCKSREHSKKEGDQGNTYKGYWRDGKKKGMVRVRVRRIGLMDGAKYEGGYKDDRKLSMVKGLYFLLTVPNTPVNSSKEPSREVGRALEHTNG